MTWALIILLLTGALPGKSLFLGTEDLTVNSALTSMENGKTTIGCLDLIIISFILWKDQLLLLSFFPPIFVSPEQHAIKCIKMKSCRLVGKFKSMSKAESDFAFEHVLEKLRLLCELFHSSMSVCE